MSKHILAIDPGPEKSGYIFLLLSNENIFYIINKYHIDNNLLRKIIYKIYLQYTDIEVVIETIVSYGNVIGQSTIDTAIWAGRFFQMVKDINGIVSFIECPNIKLNLCHNRAAKPKNVKQAIKDRFGKLGTKKNPGRLYNLRTNLEKGMLDHIWSSLATAITYIDINYGETK